MKRTPEMPAGWDKTHDDLFAERPGIGRPESDWATAYEQSLLPTSTHFPVVGEIYEASQDTTVQFIVTFAAPVSDSGVGLLLKGERVEIKHVAPNVKPIWAYAAALNYADVERRFIAEKTRSEPPYSHFTISLKTTELNERFQRIEK